MAKKKNAPVLNNNLRNAPILNNNLRNEPAEKFRTVNRMNEIVTMVEYSNEDDIKAYELEPNYRELTGGGGFTYLCENQIVTVGNDHSATLTLDTTNVSDGDVLVMSITYTADEYVLFGIVESHSDSAVNGYANTGALIVFDVDNGTISSDDQFQSGDELKVTICKTPFTH